MKKRILTTLFLIIAILASTFSVTFAVLAVTETQTGAVSASTSVTSQSLKTDILAVSDEATGEAKYQCVNDLTEYTDTKLDNATVIISTYYQASTDNNSDQTPVAMYVINHSGEYPGTDSDADIVCGLLDEGYIVVVVDYQNSELAISPNIEHSLKVIRESNLKNSGNYLGGLSYGKNKIYVVPSGYRIVRNVVFFDLLQSGAEGTIEKICDVWNTSSVESGVTSNGGTYEKVTDYNDYNDVIRLPNGDPMDMTYKMDIIYPSNPTGEVPVAAIAGTATVRNTCFDYHANRYHNLGFLFKGYATVSYDHSFLPFMNGEGSWGQVSNDYTLSYINDVKIHTAAIRCIKYYADDYGYSDTEIGVIGHSKASWCSLLSNPNPDMLAEDAIYSPLLADSEFTLLEAAVNQGYAQGKTYGDQPFLTDKDGNALDGSVACVYHSMGVGSSRFERYLTSQNVPTMICCGQYDTGNGWTYWEREQAAYKKSGIAHIAIEMLDGGHDYAQGEDTVYDYDRYHAFQAFFDYYLKGTAPEVLYSSINRNTGTKASDETFFLTFVAPVTEWTFLEGVSVKDASGNDVQVDWYAENNGGMWCFDNELSAGTYTVTVASSVADKNGSALTEGFSIEFTVE